MKKIVFIFFLGLELAYAQNVADRLRTATQQLLNSPHMMAANLSFYVADDQGNFVYEYQGNKGLSTASTQKVFTAIAALDKLGADFKFNTTLSYDGILSGGVLKGNLYLHSTGDPTLGSWRYPGYKPEDFKVKLVAALKSAGIREVQGDLIMDDSYFDFQSIPGGWPWNDIGNYYGAGVWGINWNENQFDLNIYDAKTVKSTNYAPENLKWVNEVKRGGTYDQSIIYTAPFSEVALINGYLPAGKTLTVTGSMPNPPLLLGQLMQGWISGAGIHVSGKVQTVQLMELNGEKVKKTPKGNILMQYDSPPLKDIVHWFMRKSVNLYGETFVKTFSVEDAKNPSFAEGIQILKKYWTDRGIARAMINFKDGSGLSPQNYASARAEVQALIYARKKDFYPIFYEALPTLNGMKMKSGTISSSKAFAGYQKSQEGKTYVFSIIVNNYSGGDISSQLYRILDILK